MKSLKIVGKLSLTKFLLFSQNHTISTLKLNCRNFVITSTYLNKVLKIYNGKMYIPLFIIKEFIGYKTGMFSVTKTSKLNPHYIKDKKLNK